MEIVDQLMRPAMSYLSRDVNISYVGFDNESSLSLVSSSTDPKYLFAVVFEQGSDGGSLWTDQFTTACTGVGNACAPQIPFKIRFKDNYQT